MATETKLGTAVVPIRVKLDQLDKDLEQARTKIDSKLGSAMDKVGKTLAGAGKAAVLGGIGAIVAGIAAVGGASLASGMEFDEAFDGMMTKTGTTGARLEQLAADATAVFKSIPTDIGAAADVVGTLNQRLGITGQTAQTLAEQLLLMGTDDAAKSTELYTRVMGDWSVKTEDASSTLDKLFKVSQLTGVGVDDLMMKVVQFGSPLRLMGFSIEEAAALFGKWEKEGVNAELVMGSLRIAAGKFAKANIPLKQGLQDTIKKIAGMKDSSAALALGMEIFGARAGPDMVAAIREGRFSIEDLTVALGDSEGAIRKTADATMDFPEKMKIMSNKLKAALQPVGQIIMDTIGQLADKAAPLIEKDLVPLIEKRLVPAIQTIGTALGQILEGDWSGGLTTLFGKETTDKILEVSSALADVENWLDTNLPAGIAILKNVWDTSLLPAFQNFWDSLVNPTTGIIPAGKLLVDWLSVEIPAAFVQSNWAFQGGTDSVDGLKSSVDNLFQPIKDFLAFLDSIEQALNDAQTAVDNLGLALHELIFYDEPWWMNVGAVPGHAGGTRSFAGGLTMVGERGPELVALPPLSRIWPHGQGPAAGGLNERGMNRGGGVAVQGPIVQFGNVTIATGEDRSTLMADVARAAEQGLRQALGQSTRFPLGLARGT